MKKIVVLMVITLLSIGMTAVAGNIKKANFKVAGNCENCKVRIEKAARSISGVSAATWNQATKMLSVSYDEKKTNTDHIQKAIAQAGHDTGKYKTPAKVYNALPMCCKYRK